LSSEDERPVDPAAADEVAQQLALAFAIDGVDNLANELDRGIAARDLNIVRLVKQAVGQLADLVRERGREEQVLTPRRQQGEDPANVANEAHVQHAVGLVETRISTDPRSMVP